jgi:hypothetical protein
MAMIIHDTSITGTLDAPVSLELFTILTASSQALTPFIDIAGLQFAPSKLAWFHLYSGTCRAVDAPESKL